MFVSVEAFSLQLLASISASPSLLAVLVEYLKQK